MITSPPKTAERIIAERRDRVLELTLNRPSAGNAFDAELYGALADLLADAASDVEVSCVVLGGGDRFSAGADLRDLAADPARRQTARDAYDRLLGQLEQFPKPLIAAVAGPAVGIGFTLLGHVDIVLVADNARFRAPFAALGLVPEAGSSATLPAMLGPQRAAHLFYSGAWLSAEQAVEAGLALCRVPVDELRSTAAALADRIAAAPLSSLTATKRLLAASRVIDAAAARRREDEAFTTALADPGVNAGLQKVAEQIARKNEER
ncbi:enoyl-CoA hydratase-related protein [Amycolatopsis jejuensis]|uniref:enoyl-CoA hydratase-related protein n=1 Tax=Amycolatopsis jejuensis TaxID=330084 RepID=UPI00068EA30B|nr:enoyl-CoA hydratase-related protein [Amycolatopsis jejuensis]